MSKADELLEAWARKEFGVSEGETVSISDASVTDGGCDTCGHGGDTGYYLTITIRAEGATNWAFGTYRTEEWQGSFIELLDTLLKDEG